LLRRLPILITHDYFCMILVLLHGRLAITVSLLPQRITDSFLCPCRHRVGALCIDERCLSVRLSVPCLTLIPERKLKIGGKEAHDTGDPWPHLQIKRSKVKVTRPINAMTENHVKFGRSTNFKLGIYGWSTMTRITDMHSDLQAESSGWLFKSPLAGGGGIRW